MKAMTETQRVVVERLLSKGWVEPLQYRTCVYLFLPHVTGGRQSRISRDWRRKPIRVTADGSVTPVSAWECAATQDETTQDDAAEIDPATRRKPKLSK